MLRPATLFIAVLFVWVGSQSSTAAPASPDPENMLYLDVDYGRVVIQMRPDLAPQHVTRIKHLVRSGFYDGIVFHRVIEGALAQGGDPTGRGDGGSGRRLKPEFTRTPQVRGIVSMARGKTRDSADSQFFIVLGDVRGALEGQYTVWGEVTSGMEFVDMIHAGDKKLQGKVLNPDRIIKMQMASDIEQATRNDVSLKNANIAPEAADFSPGDFRCTALAGRAGSEIKSALARLWAHGYIAGFARVGNHLTFADNADSGITESCSGRPDAFLRIAAHHAAEMPHDLPTGNGAFNSGTYTCNDFVTARKNTNKGEAELAGLWSFAFIQGYKNVAQPELEMPFEARPQLIEPLAKACEKSPDSLLVDLTAAFAGRVKLQ